MKVPTKTITVTLADPEGDAIFTFERLRENEKERFSSALLALSESYEKLEKAEPADVDKALRFSPLKLEGEVSRHRKTILSKCLSVENYSEGGREITVDDVREGNLYDDTVMLLVQGFNGLLKAQSEADAKNVTSPPAQESGSKLS